MVNPTGIVRFAILDLNEGQPNQGMRCIKDIVYRWANEKKIKLVYDVFDVRVKNELPDMSYDIYISSGGPGDPLSTRFDDWDINWNKWLNETLRWNENPGNEQKKFVFFICHSFQLASRHFNAGLICKRKSTSFGVFPIHLLPEGRDTAVFKDLSDPFYAVDSRDFQLIQPNFDILNDIGAYITCIEKDRPHVPYERAVMGISFSPYMMGTQFHPEADAAGMLLHFQNEEKRQTVIDNHGEEKLNSMIDQLKDPDKIIWTNRHLIPGFLNEAYEHIMAANTVA
ncbi:type 1 glutamine amidotransferase [Niabella soli]|uniref:GMP synthase n=1 Tax=Niabella soli DSM 19437 TaxID=929713 RepID=W0EVQ6_9BACT|nr:GMP synthase [Niabella soli]AHF14890.1 GMP synthase [Niabella soli DSM 19437]